VCVCDRLVGKRTVLLREVMRSGKQKDKSVPMNVILTDADDRPSQVGGALSSEDDENSQKTEN